MTPESMADQVEAWIQYSRKVGSLSLADWMDSKGFTREERAAIKLALWERVAR